MNATVPPKKERGLGATLKTAKLRRKYRYLEFVQAPFGFVFWLIEQCKARLQDRIDNEP